MRRNILFRNLILVGRIGYVLVGLYLVWNIYLLYSDREDKNDLSGLVASLNYQSADGRAVIPFLCESSKYRSAAGVTNLREDPECFFCDAFPLNVDDILQLNSIEQKALDGDEIAQFKMYKAYLLSIHRKGNPQRAFYWLQKSFNSRYFLAIQDTVSFLKSCEDKSHKELAVKVLEEAWYTHQNNWAGLELAAEIIFAQEANVQDYETAIEVLEILISKNVSRANFLMGNMYFKGLGVEKNDEIAFQYYEAGAKSGDLISMHALAVFYLMGVGVEQDIDQGVKLLMILSRLGYPKSIKLLKSEFPEVYKNNFQ